MPELLIYLVAGALAGLIAGLLGVGGGTVMVPALLIIFTTQGIDPSIIMHLALGTSLGIMVLTAFSSLRAHHQHGAVDWLLVRQLVGGILLGALLSGWVALPIPTRSLQIGFAVFLILVALQILISPSTPRAKTTVPSYERPLVGGIIGIVSGLLGIGGGTLSVPYFSWRGESMTTAVGTASALGWFIAIAGAIGYLWAGWQHPSLPAYSSGFINWQALLWMAPISFIFAPVGARLSHRLPVKQLKRLFALFLFLVAVKLIISQ